MKTQVSKVAPNKIEIFVGRDRFWYIASLFPILLVVLAYFGGGHFLKSSAGSPVWTIRDWLDWPVGAPVVVPVQARTVVAQGNTLLVATTLTPQHVRAIIDGTVESGTSSSLRIRSSDQLKALTVTYQDLDFISVTKGEFVKAGQTVGEISPIPGKSVLRLVIERNSTALGSPENDLSEQITKAELDQAAHDYQVVCSGCHELRRVGPLVQNGKLLSGNPATLATITSRVRVGGGRMPPFSKEVMPTRELEAIALFLIKRDTASRSAETVQRQ